MLKSNSIIFNDKSQRLIESKLHIKKFQTVSKGFTPREQVIEVVNKLFVYTDKRAWNKIIDEVFTELVLFDMSSAGGDEAAFLSSKEICNNWDHGLSDIDALHHQAGNYLVKIDDAEATVEAYAIAIHFKKKAVNGNTREFVGSYELSLSNVQDKGWRIKSFKYNLKFMDGNV